MKILPHSFFDRPAPEVAKNLLGCVLVKKVTTERDIKKDGSRLFSKVDEAIRVIITETEAYEGFKDKASHASRGKTTRNEVMFRSAGHIYVYFTYGMHWMLNIVTGNKDHPAAVLIRGVILSEDKTEQQSKKIIAPKERPIKLDGPAKLTKYLEVDNRLNGKKLGKSTGLWVEMPTNTIQTPQLKQRKIASLPRVGVNYAGPIWSKKKWRFVLKK